MGRRFIYVSGGLGPGCQRRWRVTVYRETSKCRSCEGRGVKLVSRRGSLAAAEDVVVYAVRPCIDCGGPPALDKNSLGQETEATQ